MTRAARRAAASAAPPVRVTRTGVAPTLVALTLVALSVVALTGCSPTVVLTPAPAATATGCAALIARVRSIAEVGTQPYRETDAQGTAAWGDPVSVVLTCGVEDVPGTTCISYDDVDWKRSDESLRRVVLRTYGRSPAVEVRVDTTRGVSVNDVLQGLSPAVHDAIRASRRCPTSAP